MTQDTTRIQLLHHDHTDGPPCTKCYLSQIEQMFGVEDEAVFENIPVGEERS